MRKYTFLIFLLTTFFATYSQTPGSVLSYKKIGNNLGNLGAIPANGYFGSSIISIGDINNDGVEDLAVGAFGSRSVYILRMDTNGTVQSKSILGPGMGNMPLNIDNSFGKSVTNLGDLNGDGNNDIAVGCDYSSDGGVAYTGAIYIITLSDSGTALNYTKISKTSGYGTGGLPLTDAGYFGSSVDTIGDLNNNGVVDLIVGNHFDLVGSSNIKKGSVWVIFLNEKLNVDSFYNIYDGVSNFNSNQTYNNAFGTSVTGIGDDDNDGVEDIAVGACWDDDGLIDAGAFYIIRLNTNGSVKNFKKISNLSFASGTPFSHNTGYSLRKIIDLDGNGVRDYVAGQYRYDNDDGAIIFIMMDTLNNPVAYKQITDMQITSVTPSSRFGFSLAGYGDYNNDGYFELLVGAFKDGSSFYGGVYILTVKSSIGLKFTKILPNCNVQNSGVIAVQPFGGTAPYTYLWSNSVSNDTITNVAAGNYFVTVTDYFNKSAFGSVILNSPPRVEITSNGDKTICLGDSTQISVSVLSSATSNINYYWSNSFINSSTLVVNPASTSVYSVYASDGVLCNSDIEYISVIVNPLPQPDLGPDTTMTFYQSVFLQLDPGSFSSYLWSTGATTQTASNMGFSGDSTIWVMVTDQNGCSNSDSIYIHLINGIDNNYSETGGVNIFPNPTNDILNIELENNLTITSIHIYNVVGQLVEQISTGTNKAIINTESIEPGIYTVVVNFSYVSKFVKR